MFELYVDRIEQEGQGVFTLKILQDLLTEFESRKSRIMLKFERYRGSTMGVPIYGRTLPVESNKINNKLANDWFSEIVDTKIGYMFGTPVTYNLDKAAKNHQIAVDSIQRFRRVNNLDDMNGELGKFAAIGGYANILAYIDKEGQERALKLDPWESIVLSRTEITEPEYGVRIYPTWDLRMRVEIYDKTHKTVYEGADASALEQKEYKPHMFNYCPMVGVPNNSELQGDADKVMTLIDAYDRSMSDFNSEIEQFRLAYMLFFGVEPDEEAVQRMRQTGALYVPSTDGQESKNDIKFLTKDLNNTFIDSHLDRLEKNISRFAKHVNFVEAFGGGSVTGPAMRYKLFMLETKAKYFERKHEAALAYLFKVIGSAWEKKAIAFDWTQLEFKYTRNIPVNIVDEANAASALLAVTSRRTALSTLSVVPDPDEEMDQIEQEKQAIGSAGVNLDILPGSTGGGTGGGPGGAGGTGGNGGNGGNGGGGA